MNHEEIYQAFYKIHDKKALNNVVRNFLEASSSMGFRHTYSAEKICSFYDDSLYYHSDPAFELFNYTLYRADTYDDNAYSFEQTIRKHFSVFRKLNYLLAPMFYFLWMLGFVPMGLLLLTIYRNVSIRFFLISLGITLALVLLNVLLLVVIDIDNSWHQVESVMVVLFSCWAVLLFLLSSKGFIAPRYNRITAYAAFLLNLLLPYLPIILGFLLLEKNDEYISGDEMTFYLIAIHISGMACWAFMQQMYFKPLYERLMALPD